jgi:hypothetical protein
MVDGWLEIGFEPVADGPRDGRGEERGEEPEGEVQEGAL